MTESSNKTKIIAFAAIGLLIVVAVLIGVMLTSNSPDMQDEEMAAMPPDTTNQPAPPGKSGLAAADENGDGVVYQSGMHPWIVMDEPGTCPVCGMDLVPVRVDGMEEGTVRIDPVTMQNMGVRTARVVIEPLNRTVRTTGRFEAPEQGMTAVSPKISGWVEKLHVNYEGARVGKGQPLLEIYSPELVSTQEEYLLAVRNLQRMEGSPTADDARRLVEAARRRLGYWDISEAQIKRLEERGEPTKTLTLYAPAAGTVTETNVMEGQQVMAGQTLLRLANLSTLWLMVDVYEQDLSWVGTGTRATIELPYAPGNALTGKVSYIYDELNPELRTVMARVAVPNPGLKLKPGMYATVTLLGGETEALPVVPSEAIIRTGEREVVVIAEGEGRFRPVPVRVGMEADGRAQILEGLIGDEMIVTSAQFLIDSEARLASAVSAMMMGSMSDEEMQDM